MKILFIAHYFPPEGNAPAARAHELCRAWVKEGHDVTVITGVPNVPNGVVYEGYRNRWRQVEEIDGIRAVRVMTYIAPNSGTTRRILNYISFMVTGVFAGLRVDRPDVVIATSPQFFCGWAGAIVGWLRRLPFILEIRDIWPESIVAVGAMRRGRCIRILEWLELKLYAAALHIVTVGDGYRRVLLTRGVPDERISVITNGVDLARFTAKPGSGTAVRDRHAPGAGFVCSYVGTIGMASGLDVVLRAAGQLKAAGHTEFRFLLVGDGATRAALQRQAEEEGLDTIVFTGRVPRDEVPTYLAASDACLIHLKNTETFRTVLPSKLFEAAAMGCPIVLGVAGDAAELLTKAGGGICIEPENADQLVAALEEVAADPALASALGEAGRTYIAEHFDRDKLALDYLAVIECVLRSPGHSGNS